MPRNNRRRRNNNNNNHNKNNNNNSNSNQQQKNANSRKQDQQQTSAAAAPEPPQQQQVTVVVDAIVSEQSRCDDDVHGGGGGIISDDAVALAAAAGQVPENVNECANEVAADDRCASISDAEKLAGGCPSSGGGGGDNNGPCDGDRRPCVIIDESECLHQVDEVDHSTTTTTTNIITTTTNTTSSDDCDVTVPVPHVTNEPFVVSIVTDAPAPVSTTTVGPVALDYATTADTDTPTPPPQPRQHHPAAMDAATVAHEDDATTLIAGNQPAAASSAAVDDCSNELMCEATSLADSAIVTVGPTSVDGAAAAAVARDAHNTSDTAEMPTPETAARESTTAPPPPKPVTITIAHSFTYESSAGQPVEIRALAEDVVESSTATTTVASGGNQVGNTNDLDAGEHAAEVENVLSRSPMRRTFEQAYRVESPKPAAAVAAAAKRVALGEIKKSRSMDDNEMLIQEMSDTGSTSGENENTPIVSEAESEVETTTASGGAGQPDQTQTIQLNGEDVVVLDDRLFVPIKATQETNVECIRYADPPVVDLSEEEEALIRELMNGAASVQDAQAQRARKKAAIESHFYPQFINPKYLDVIKEESDAGSSTDRSGNVSPSRTKMYEDLEDDVFLDNAEISAKANTVFPKSSFDFSSRRKHVSRLRGPKGSVIREEPQCVLVGAKIVDPEQNREGCGAWTTSVIDGEKEHSAELVYLAGGSSSSSASDMCDLDSTSAGDEADAEDQDGVDSDDVRINTPTIGGDGNQRLFALWSDPEPTTPATNTTRPDPTPIVPPAEPSPSAHVPEFRIGAPCSANMFPILSPADILAKHNIITRITHDFTRQDSSGSLCSTVSHSTTHSQCTARFCSNPSPPRDLLDFEGSAPCVSGPNSLVRTDPRQMETLRQLCLDRLSNMPYGYLILKELATVAGSLGELVGRHNTQLHEQRLREQEPVRQPSKSPSPPPVPQLPKVQSWLGFPAQDQPATTTTHPTLTHQATSHPVHTHVTERLVGQVLTTICEHQQRTDESTDDVSTGAVDNNRLLAIIRGAGDQSEPAAATNGSIPTAAPSQPKPHSEPQREIPKMTAESDVTKGAKVHVIRVETGGDIPRRTADAITTNGAKNPTGLWDSSSVSSTSSSKHFSSTSSSSSCSSSSTLKSSITSGAQPADTKHYSSQESSSTQAERRIENGNVVFDFVDSTSQRSSTGNKDDVNCIAANVPKHPTVEVKTTATSTDDTAMKSDIKLDRNETRASSHAASAAPPTIQSVHSHEHPPQPAARNSTDARIDGGNVRAAATTTKHVEYFDHDRLRFSDFNAFANEFFMEHPSPASTESPRAPTASEPSPATPSDSIDIPVEHIVKPIAIEEDLCKGRLIHHQIRAPRISDTQPSLATSFDETKRQYDIATHLNNHNQRTSSRLSMIDETPITTHVSPHPTHHPVPPRRRLSLPKELHDKQMDYIRQKEVELHLEYDKLEQERRTLMRDIEQMKVNQAFQDFVTAHKNQVRQSTTQAFTNFASEAELLRQKMHDEWLGKVAEREERRLHKIIKITKPNETELFAPPPPIPEATKPLPVGLHPPNLGNEFLSKVKERRTKLKMPSDSDWESGAESQPEPRKSTESKLDPSIKVLEGSTETDVTKLPSHLREFACEFTKKEESFSNYQSSSEHSVERVRRNGTEDGIWSPSTTPTLPRKNPQPPTTSTPIVTTPGTPATATPIRSPSKTSLPSPTPPTPPPPPPFWAPSPSPTLERKEFRPIKFESPVAARKIFTKDTNQPPTSPPWTNQQQAPERLSTVLTAPFQGGANSASGVRQIPITLQHTPHKVSFVEPPQVTQKHHEQLLTTHQSGGQRIVQEEQSYSSSSTSSRCVSGSSSQQQQQSEVTQQQQQLHRQPPPPPLPQPPKQPQQQQPISSTHSGTATRSNEVIHPIRVEGVVEHQHSEAERSSNIAMKHQQQQQQQQTQTQRQETAQTVPARPKCAEIGPTTRDGMPIVLRSEVEEDLHHKWYKRMYNTLHKVHQDDDSVTVRYKTRRGRYPYKSNGYISEPEPSYDTDYSSTKYSTLDRRRSPVAAPVIEPVPRYQPQAPLLRHYADDNLYGTLPAKSTPSAYKLNPGRIENFTPGNVAASDKDRKDRLEYERPVQRAYYEGNLSKALKDQGYESDSTLVFRKKEQAQLSHLNHDQQKQAYMQLQAGGEVPIHGFRKPAPEKPKDSEVVPPPPPVKGASAMHASMTSSTNGTANGSHTIDVQLEAESPRRYVESDVNIHYKTPVRYEYKDPVPELELAYRQSEHMKHLYADERHRKYLQELQDISNRRHADYFSPNQKSPIALNRYDDIGADAAAPVTPPRIIARALYNFQGLTARELSFKKGDIIYIRREVDKNWYEGEHNATVGLLPSNYVEIISKDGARTAAPKKPTEGQARAKFNFHAQSAIELSLNKGELVSLTRRVDDNWFEGRIANRKGIFPVSYVDILTDIGSTESQYISVTSKLVGSPSTVAGHSLTVVPTHEYSTSRTNLTAELHQSSNNNNNSQHINANLVAPSNGHANGAYISGSHVSPSGTVRETKTIQKTEVLHVDTHSEPIAYRAIYMYRPQNTDELELHEGDTVYVLEKCDDGWFVGTSQRTGCFGTFPGNYVEKI